VFIRQKIKRPKRRNSAFKAHQLHCDSDRCTVVTCFCESFVAYQFAVHSLKTSLQALNLIARRTTMPFPNFSKQAVAKALLASVLFAVLAGVAGSQLAPDMPLPTVLLYSAAGAAALFCLLVLVAVVTATYVQFIQRMGGTDPQWFWFSAEPPGLVKLREEAREANALPQAIKK
jgi:hypothetical protein